MSGTPPPGKNLFPSRYCFQVSDNMRDAFYNNFPIQFGSFGTGSASTDNSREIEERESDAVDDRLKNSVENRGAEASTQETGAEKKPKKSTDERKRSQENAAKERVTSVGNPQTSDNHAQQEMQGIMLADNDKFPTLNINNYKKKKDKGVPNSSKEEIMDQEKQHQWRD